MRPGQDQRLSSIIRRAAAEFLEREIRSQLIMTVNRVEIVDHGHLAKIYVTIFPDEAEQIGLDEAKRLQYSLQQRLREQLKDNHLPFLEIVIDEEEKLKRVQNLENQNGLVTKG